MFIPRWASIFVVPMTGRFFNSPCFKQQMTNQLQHVKSSYFFSGGSMGTSLMETPIWSSMYIYMYLLQLLSKLGHDLTWFHPGSARRITVGKAQNGMSFLMDVLSGGSKTIHMMSWAKPRYLLHSYTLIVPVVPHKAVAEVSKIGNL